MNIILMFVLERLADKALDKILEKVMSDANLKRLNNFLKIQLLVLYLDWQLHKTQLPKSSTSSLNPADEKVGDRSSNSRT